jgi:predicted DNA-binding transcriptional regulator AlpA
VVPQERGRRMLIDRSLDRVAEEIYKVLEDLKKHREAARRELLRKAIVLRASGLTVNEVIEATGVPRSTLYRYPQHCHYPKLLYLEAYLMLQKSDPTNLKIYEP